MGIENTKNGKLLYHLTALENIDSILENGLVSRKVLIQNVASFSDVADQEIVSKRTIYGLDNYIPFHFHPYSSFDVAVKSSYPNKEFIYLCITREFAKYNNFKILPIHPLSMEEPQLYEYDEGFNKIDWDTLQTIGMTGNYTKQVKMAECLTELIIPANHLQCIYVRNEDIKLLVEEKLSQKSITPSPYVNIQQVWF